MALSLHQLCIDRPASAPGDSVCVLDELSLSVPPGRHVAVAGQPRFGGTLLAQVVAGIRKPVAGEIRLHGADLAEQDLASGDQASRAVAFIPSGGGLLPQLSLRRNIVFGARLRQYTVGRWRLDDEREHELDRWLERFSLTECAGRVPDWVTGTQRLLAALVRALLRMPEVLVVDATGGPDTDRAYRTMLTALRRTELGGRIGVLLCTTRQELLADCDEVLVIDSGEVAHRGRLIELRDRCTPRTAPVLFGDPLLIVPDGAGTVVLTPDEIAVELVGPGDIPAGRLATVLTGPDQHRFQDIAERPDAERWRLRLPPGQHLPVGSRVAVTRGLPS